MSGLDTPVSYVKGVGPVKAEVLAMELKITKVRDLLWHFPFRHEDRSKIYKIQDLNESLSFCTFIGRISRIEVHGLGRAARITFQVKDETGSAELVWFQGVERLRKQYSVGEELVVAGKPSLYMHKISIAHPEVERYQADKEIPKGYFPYYETSDKMKRNGLNSKGFASIMQSCLMQFGNDIKENLPDWIVQKYRLLPRKEALCLVHFPANEQQYAIALRRLKFEELFFNQLKLLIGKQLIKEKNNSQVFSSAALVTTFYKDHLPFDLTNAQKKVIKEIYADLRSGKQMNRLLQGDVGSGKTIVAFICSLIAIDSEAQVCLLAPTELLAEQHFKGLKTFADSLGIPIRLLRGSSTAAERREIDAMLKDGSLGLLVGTHAILEDKVEFKNLGLAIIDEQHRFGVEQRAKLWRKNSKYAPHILVMTATPIPRTLAMTLYGDLDVSVIDELPKGRKPIVTQHYYESKRLLLFEKVRQELAAGRQAYFVYPMIEESEKVDLHNATDGFEALQRYFTPMDFQVEMVHGKMNNKDKDFGMQRFVKGEVKVLVATTVIEVGINVPNATVMVIENAERFGLSQLHQLRGRVGRGGDQSYCFLVTGNKLSRESKERIATMVRTNNGFEIAEADLKLRGPGDMAGTRQSGIADLKLAELTKDQAILDEARKTAIEILTADPALQQLENKGLKKTLDDIGKGHSEWSRIS